MFNKAKFICIPIKQNNDNKIAKILKGLSIFTFVVGGLYGLAASNTIYNIYGKYYTNFNWAGGLSIWCISFIAGIDQWAIAEIITLLYRKQTQSYEIQEIIEEPVDNI